MYKFNDQLRLVEFDMSMSRLDGENPWVLLSSELDWDGIEERYASVFSSRGKAAINARIAFGAVVIKHTYGVSDKMLVQLICENPYLQYFIGMPGFQPTCPFSEHSVPRFEKRIEHGEITKCVSRLRSMRK